MPFQTVVFDLDGTLLNTLADLHASCNHALAEMDRPLRTLDQVRAFVGNGVRTLCERLLGDGASAEEVDRCIRLFQAHYNLHLNDTTSPYDGIVDLLKTLRSAGVARAVVSNKYHEATSAICDRYFENLIDVAIGEGNGIKKKPCPDGVNRALELLGCPRETALYVGDSDVDVMTARAAALPCVGVTWGFRSRELLQSCGADFIIDQPSELINIVMA